MTLPPAATWQGVAFELRGAAIAGTGFLLVFAIAETWRLRGHPSVEATRKLVHFGSGVVAAFFPWLFATHWTVLGLTLASGLLMRATKHMGWLGSVHAVERTSRGELYYPIGVYALFALARHQPVFYLIALSTLVVADALAALLGRRYGRLTYPSGPDGTERKSLEGSAAFFFATFVGTQLMLLLFTDVSRVSSVIVAAQVALLVTSFEAISQHGNDNLVVPLATYYLLLKMTPKPPIDSAFHLAVQLAILLGTLIVARRTGFFTFGGAIAAHLVLYGAFSLGGHTWILAPALALAGCIALERRRARATGHESPGRQVQAVFWVSIVSILLIFADNTFATFARHVSPFGGGHPFFAPFVGALAAPLAIMMFQFLRLTRRLRGRSVALVAIAAAAAGFVIVAPLSLWVGPSGLTLPALATAAAMCLGAVALYVPARQMASHHGDVGADFRLQALSVVVTTVLLVPIHLWWTGAL